MVEALKEVADALGASIGQVALAWVTGRPGVTSTILRTRTVEQLEDKLRRARLKLAREHSRVSTRCPTRGWGSPAQIDPVAAHLLDEAVRISRSS